MSGLYIDTFNYSCFLSTSGSLILKVNYSSKSNIEKAECSDSNLERKLKLVQDANKKSD